MTFPFQFLVDCQPILSLSLSVSSFVSTPSPLLYLFSRLAFVLFHSLTLIRMWCRTKAIVPKAATRQAVASAFAPALVAQQRYLEYWGLTVTGRTQPYAQGDMLPRTDNTRIVVNAPSSAAASVTGNNCGIAYDSSNIFSVEGFSPLERDHYQPLRGLSRYKVDPLQQEGDGPATAELMETMRSGTAEASLTELWWSRVLRDFPSLKTPCTPEFQRAWEEFYIKAASVANDEKAVTALSRPFLQEQLQKNYISHALVWRLAERLGDALNSAPSSSRYERRAGRETVERVTKIMLNTIADEPWSSQDATSPLNLDPSNFRPWHEAGFW